MTAPRLRQLGDRRAQLAAELRDINAEIGMLEQARRRLGLHAPSCLLPDITDVWVQNGRNRVERALAPQPVPNQAWKPSRHQAGADYEPGIADVVGAAR
jgi:hypothetical protein